MAVHNIHRRPLTGWQPEQVGKLIDALSCDHDRLWPSDHWPAMQLDHGLQVGSIGGHGPIHYTVEDYVPGVWVRFRFSRPRGFDGFHEFTRQETDSGTELRHTLVITPRGPAHISWPLLYRWLHDALLEDLMDRAELIATGTVSRPAHWTGYVRLLRRLAASGSTITSRRNDRRPTRQRRIPSEG